MTEEGLLLKRRALEIIDLENKIIEEFKGNEEVIEGTITIGCGEFNAVDHIAKICKIFQEKYPRIQIALHTATADVVQEMMNKGLVDIGLLWNLSAQRTLIISGSEKVTTGLSV